jgi:hypothetical protein
MKLFVKRMNNIEEKIKERREKEYRLYYSHQGVHYIEMIVLFIGKYMGQ